MQPPLGDRGAGPDMAGPSDPTEQLLESSRPAQEHVREEMAAGNGVTLPRARGGGLTARVHPPLQAPRRPGGAGQRRLRPLLSEHPAYPASG